MRRVHRLVLGQLAVLAVLAGTAFGQDKTAPAKVRMYVPADAQVEIEGVKTRQTGALRDFVTPALTVGKTYTYNVKVTYTNLDGKPVVENHKVRVVGGETAVVDLRPGAGNPPANTEEKKPAKTSEVPAKTTEKPPVGRIDVPFVRTPQAVVDKMLEMANVTDDDVVYDLGCGDGQILVTAAKKYKAHGVGIDINPRRVEQARENVQKAGVEKLVEIRQGSFFKVPDLGKATVVTLYLLPDINLKLLPILKKELKPGTRIVSHDFDMGEWKPLKEETVEDKNGNEHRVYLWKVGTEAPKEGAKESAAEAEPKQVAQNTKQEKEAKPVKRPKLDVPWVPTPQEVVDKILELGKVKKDDVLYDLGCGDGRIVVTAAKKFGCKSVGVDLDPVRVKESLENVKTAGVEKLAEIREGNALKVSDIGKATIVTLYLLPDVNLKLRPILLKELKPGSRIVSHDFDMGDWKPEKEIMMKDKSGDEHTLYLWTVPAKKEGARLDGKEEIPAPALALADEDKEPDVIYVPTPQAVVDKMLELAKVKKGDVVYDLGCGDGRIPVTAAKKFGCKGFGFDVDPQRIKESNENVKKNAVEKLVTIQKKDIFTLDLSPANVVTLYLLPSLNVKLIPQLEKLKPGSRIVTHDFDMEGVKPDQIVKLNAKDDRGNEREHTIYVFSVPLKKEKK